MTPQTTSIDIWCTRLAASSTKPVTSIAPANAVTISTAELMPAVFPSRNTMTSDTVSLAPEEIPSTNGPAIGLWKNVCNRYPASASAPPRISTAAARGRRMFHTIPYTVSLTGFPLTHASSSRSGIDTLPIPIFNRKNATTPIPSTANAAIWRV